MLSRLVKLRFSLMPLPPASSPGAAASGSSCLREPARRALPFPRKAVGRPSPPEAGKRDTSACAACGAAMRVVEALPRPSAGPEAAANWRFGC